MLRASGVERSESEREGARGQAGRPVTRRFTLRAHCERAGARTVEGKALESADADRHLYWGPHPVLRCLGAGTEPL